MKSFIGYDAASKYYHIPRGTLVNAVFTGKLKRTKSGKHIVFTKKALDEYKEKWVKNVLKISPKDKNGKVISAKQYVEEPKKEEPLQENKERVYGITKQEWRSIPLEDNTYRQLLSEVLKHLIHIRVTQKVDPTATKVLSDKICDILV